MKHEDMYKSISANIDRIVPQAAFEAPEALEKAYFVFEAFDSQDKMEFYFFITAKLAGTKHKYITIFTEIGSEPRVGITNLKKLCDDNKKGVIPTLAYKEIEDEKKDINKFLERHTQPKVGRFDA